MASDTILSSSLNGVMNSLNDKNKRALFIRNFSKFVDRQHEALYSNNPGNRIFMTDTKDRDWCYEMVNIQPEYIKGLIKKCDVFNSKWRVLSNPFNVLMTFFVKKGVESKDKQFTNCSLMYLTISLYSSLQFKYYNYPPNENCMEYTINNLSNKFLMKKYGILYKVLEHTAITCHEKYVKGLLAGEDIDIKDYIMNLRTRLNNFIKQISSEYYRNLENKKYLNREEDNLDAENFHATDNLSLEINKMVENTVNKFLSGDINPAIVRSIAKFVDISKVTLGQALNNIKDKETDKVKTLITDIIIISIKEGNISLSTIKMNFKKFLEVSLRTYSKSNLRDENILEMKKILDEFMMKHCDKYSDAEKRVATKISYRKAVYMYFVFIIHAYNK